jgi:hypothetical protein
VRIATPSPNRLFTGHFQQSESPDGSGPDGNSYIQRNDADDFRTPGDVEALYRDLDGAVARHAGTTCTVNVYGIHDMGTERWIQLSVAGDRACDLIVRAARTASSSAVLGSIETWLANPRPDGRNIHVA